MRRMPVLINKPIRGKLTRYRPGASQVLEEGELIDLGDIGAESVLSSRKIGAARVVAGPAART